MYILKKETFTVVDGPDSGKTYHRGGIYDKIPPGYEARFEPITPIHAKESKPPRPVVKPDLKGDEE